MLNPREELMQLLHALNLSQMAALVEPAALRAAKEGLTHEAFLLDLVRSEQAAKRARRMNRLIQQSDLAPAKTFDNLNIDRFDAVTKLRVNELKSGAFLKDAINIVAIGNPGVGKSHLACALGYALISEEYSVKFVTTSTLMQQLLAAKRDLCLPKAIAKLDRFECLILDDIGYVQHNRDEMEVLFTLLAERYERKSVIITTNLVFSEWERIFKDPMTTAAAIDRVVHHSVVLDLMAVESYRAESAKAKSKKRLVMA